MNETLELAPMSDREALLERFTRGHVDAINAAVRALESFDAPFLEVPPWKDGPPDFDGSDKPETLEDALALGLKWQEYAEKLHDLLCQHAAHAEGLADVARDAREALIAFDDWHPKGCP